MMLAVPLVCASVLAGPPAQNSALKHSDVVFMFQGSRQTYADYGATVLAWGGTPTPQSLAEAAGLRFFGSVGMVTEFGQYYERFPDTYQQALCRDVEGNPVKVPWLTDLQHKGVPYWWCCTQQPLFRQYLRERVVQTVKAGAAGLHVDDHLGTSGGLWQGLCFCDRCLEGFRAYLKKLPAADLARLGVADPAVFDYRATLKAWLAAAPAGRRQVMQHPLWHQWTAYQCRAAAAFMQELRKLAADTAGHPVPVAANAGLLWPHHLVDYRALDLFSAETEHHAATRRPSDGPLVAYRLAEAVGRPYAATASGQDWAYVKEHDLPGLVRCWIALSYAGGQNLMAPHHQWCYTPEKGTHWYDGPKERFAPLYRFVREHADLFDGYDTYADVGVVVPHAAFERDAGRWMGVCGQLAAANVSYRILLGGDDIVDHSLAAADVRSCPAVLAPDVVDLLPVDAQRLDGPARQRRLYANVDDALAAVRPAVRVEASGPVRALPRVRRGSAVVHLLSYRYDPAKDDVRPLSDVKVALDLKALGVPGVKSCRLVAPGAEPITLEVTDGTVVVPSLGLWGLLVFGRQV